MATFRENLDALLANAGPDIDGNTVAELSTMAERLTALGVSAPRPPAPTPPSKREAARSELAALPPLPAGASDEQRNLRAVKQAQLLAVTTGMRQDSNANTFYVDPDALDDEVA